VTNWLSFWNAETRRQEADELDGAAVASIYVPFGNGEIDHGDVIYCVAVEDGELRLLTRIVASTLNDDPEHAESVRVEDDADVPVTDYNRVVTPGVLAAIRFTHTDGTERGMVTPGEDGGHVDAHRFQGRSSLRQLVAGAAGLDMLLADSDADPVWRAVSAVEALAEDYERALDLLEGFCERFYWIKDHLDYQAEVREFLAQRSREPRGVG
jgi:hypothetical protein